MRLAIHNPIFVPPYAETLAATARAADETGCATFTCMDHWFQMENLGGPAEPMLEGYAALGFAAAHTERIALGLLVTGVTYRHPGLLAKIVATVDALSGGRAFLGIGAAWYDREHHGLGVPFPPLSERYGRLEEALRICRQMWSGDDGPFSGRYYDLAETVCVPAPATTPRILIGGSGEKKTLRLVAEHADACNLFSGDVETVARKLEVLDRHCADLGRDPGEIERTIIGGSEGVRDDLDGFVEQMRPYAALGISQVWLSAPAEDPAEWVRACAGYLVPRLADL